LQLISQGPPITPHPARLLAGLPDAWGGALRQPGNIAGVSGAAAETRQTAMRLLDSAGELSAQSETMRASVEGFFATIRAA
jgi:methyl-accepting chemotaxis protein